MTNEEEIPTLELYDRTRIMEYSIDEVRQTLIDISQWGYYACGCATEEETAEWVTRFEELVRATELGRIIKALIERAESLRGVSISISLDEYMSDEDSETPLYQAMFAESFAEELRTGKRQ